MNIRKYNDGIHISGQISIKDLPALVKIGIRTVICNRPDKEVEGQREFSHIQQAAAKHDIISHYIPITSTGITEENLNDMISALIESERPLLAYCRSGARSDRIYNLTKRYLEEKKQTIVLF
ncbi:MAG: hypothetical protein JSC188_000093 [Candidatus Tokpelaia sp. JSC188]|nr:MAG: hypothetical protein JSC188_000093 [Candidatus Tokpelaia sp. JSC188]